MITKAQPKKKIKWDFTQDTNLLSWKKVHTVCEESKCPNRYECSQNNLATYLIGGRLCTRSCRFCYIETGKPISLKKIMADEQEEIIESVKDLKLEYVVITSVARDDEENLLAEHFSSITKILNQKNIYTELLIPDFHGNKKYLDIIGSSKPFVVAHNMETTSHLSKKIRPQASYERSLNVLQFFYENYPYIHRKSAIMLGLGEKFEDILCTLKDLRKHHVDIITIGQYMQPSKNQEDVQEYINESVFEELKIICKDLGFLAYEIGPFVRSSYMANRTMERLKKLDARI